MIILAVQPELPKQTFKQTKAGKRYTFVVKWNTLTQLWALDIFDSTGKALATGVFLTAGVQHLNQYNLDLDNLLAININDNTSQVAYDNLGTDGKFIFLEPQDINQ